MDRLRAEGIVLHAFAFQDYDRIFTVFTPEEGLLKFIYKGAHSSKKGGGSATTPLTHVEVIYTKGKSELNTLREIHILNHNLALRNNLTILESACEILQVISATQLPGKIAPDLYNLFLMYLERLPSAHNPTAISASFRLKTLRHEGLWGFISHCNICNTELSDSFLCEGEAFCRAHSPANALMLTESERGIVELLTFGRDFTQLAAIVMSIDLTAKIRRLFETSIA